jgi:hypothetical protein
MDGQPSPASRKYALVSKPPADRWHRRCAHNATRQRRPGFPPELVNLLVRNREAYADHLEVALIDRAAHFIA